MIERRPVTLLLNLALALSTLALSPAQVNSEDECTHHDPTNNSVLWTTKDETPMRISPSPDSEDRGSWPKDTELYEECWILIPHTEGNIEQQTIARFMRSGENGKKGWTITRYDLLSQVPPRRQNHSFPSTEAEDSFFLKLWDDIEARRQAVLRELSDD